MMSIETRGELFDVALEGPPGAPVVVLSNSIGTSMAMWEAQVAPFSACYRVLRYNPRGRHEASRASGDFSIAQLAEDALGLLDKLDIDEVHWCGISMGGVIGQWLLVNAPARIRRAVIANSAAYFGPAEKWQPRLDGVRENGIASIADGTVERWFTPRFRETEPETVARVRAQLLSTPARAYLGCAAALRDVDLREAVASVEHAVLLIGGSGDMATTMADVGELHRKMVNSKLVELDAAHLSNIEQAAAFNAAVLGFLRD